MVLRVVQEEVSDGRPMGRLLAATRIRFLAELRFGPPHVPREEVNCRIMRNDLLELRRSRPLWKPFQVLPARTDLPLFLSSVGSSILGGSTRPLLD